MTDNLKKIIKDELDKLPQAGRDILNSVDWVRLTEEIGKSHSLTEEEITDLQTENLLILVMIEPYTAFTTNIEDNVGTSRDKAKAIAEEIVQKILIPMKEFGENQFKKTLGSIKPDWDQNINFIASGGEYAELAPKPQPSNTANKQAETQGNKFAI